MGLIGLSQWMIFIAVGAVGRSTVLYCGAKYVAVGELTFTVLVDIFCRMIFMYFRARMVLDMLPEIIEMMKPADRVFSILESEPVTEPKKDDAPKPDIRDFLWNGKAFDSKAARTGGMEFDLRDIKFAYPTMPEKVQLRGLSMTILAGRTTALVGEAGCGKSTTFSLLQRVYDVDTGCGDVLLNGKPICHCK